MTVVWFSQMKNKERGISVEEKKGKSSKESQKADEGETMSGQEGKTLLRGYKI